MKTNTLVDLRRAAKCHHTLLNMDGAAKEQTCRVKYLEVQLADNLS